MIHESLTVLCCQVSLLGLSGAERECVALLAGLPPRLVFTIGASLAIR